MVAWAVTSLGFLMQESGAEKAGEAVGRVVGWVVGIAVIIWTFKMLSKKK